MKTQRFPHPPSVRSFVRSAYLEHYNKKHVAAERPPGACKNSQPVHLRRFASSSSPSSIRRFVLDENINNDTGISLFAVFDGHGGDFAADYAKDVLIQSIYAKVVEAHNIVTGKVVAPEVKKATPDKSVNGECRKEEEQLKDGKAEQKPKTPVLSGAERRSSFRKTNSFTDDSAVNKKRSQPDPLDIYRLNGLGPRPMTKDDFLLPVGGAEKSPAKVAPQRQEAKCYIGPDRKINFGKLLTDEVLAADHKLIETVKKMVRMMGICF